MLIVGKPGMLPRSVWVYFNARAKQTPSPLHAVLVFMQSKSRHATWEAATVFYSRSQPGLLETEAEEFLLVYSAGTVTGRKTSCKFSAVNICGQKIGREGKHKIVYKYFIVIFLKEILPLKSDKIVQNKIFSLFNLKYCFPFPFFQEK